MAWLPTAKQVAPASRRESFPTTGSFGAFRKPKVVGISDAVAISTRSLSRSARRAERTWLKTLPKGVTI